MDVTDERIRTQAIYFAKALPSPGSDWFQPDIFFIRAHKLLEYEVKSILGKRGYRKRNHGGAIYQLRKLNLSKDCSFACDILNLIRKVRNSAAHNLSLDLKALDAWRIMVHKFEEFQGIKEPRNIDLMSLDFQAQFRTYMCVVSVWVWLCQVNDAPPDFDPVFEICQEVERAHDKVLS
jgi:hypothetical protein